MVLIPGTCINIMAKPKAFGQPEWQQLIICHNSESSTNKGTNSFHHMGTSQCCRIRMCHMKPDYQNQPVMKNTKEKGAQLMITLSENQLLLDSL